MKSWKINAIGCVSSKWMHFTSHKTQSTKHEKHGIFFPEEWGGFAIRCGTVSKNKRGEKQKQWKSHLQRQRRRNILLFLRAITIVDGFPTFRERWDSSRLNIMNILYTILIWFSFLCRMLKISWTKKGGREKSNKYSQIRPWITARFLLTSDDSSTQDSTSIELSSFGLQRQIVKLKMRSKRVRMILTKW